MQATRVAIFILIGLTGLINGRPERSDNPCADHPCMEGAYCSYSGPDKYTCHCPSNVVGEKCDVAFPTEQSLHHCEDEPCQNGGTCYPQGESYWCLCPYNIGGEQCQYDPCRDEPCLNGGKCYVNNMNMHNYFCTCQSPYVGENCKEARQLDD